MIPGGPAEAAGLKVGDIVVRADGRLIGTLPAFTSALYLHPLDEVLQLEVLRGTERKTLFIPAVEMKDPMDSLSDLVNSRENLVSRLGILALSLNDELRSIGGYATQPFRRCRGRKSSEFHEFRDWPGDRRHYPEREPGTDRLSKLSPCRFDADQVARSRRTTGREGRRVSVARV